ncbi:MAG: hypothetical protein KDB03_20455 [Planctomycetales bacterium]|nr:hypothetical protein [Planctomycetales bacterium]
MTDFLSHKARDLVKGFNWLILEMDVAQWGVVASVIVIIGFLALRTQR